MAADKRDSVEDRNDTLSKADHMRGLERLQMQVSTITRPNAIMLRVTGTIQSQDTAAWAVPNVAVRLEVASPEGIRPTSRVYTIRRFDAASGTVVIDFVDHDGSSPAMDWLRAAQPGARIWLTGPRPHFLPAHLSGHRAVVLADDTAIPALEPILATWPAGAPGLLIVETADPAAFTALNIPAGVEARMIALQGAAGTTGALAAAFAAITDPQITLWAAGERAEMRTIRQHAQALGLPRDLIRVEGYWKHGVSSSEIDRARLAHYEKLRAAGGGLIDIDFAEETF
ncbi:siderophore-interacting protein [Ketogulonicigenium vulgare]|uniref:siderophore-interacting protein n=1 Tax=Ketogulonicigenium vulgare TaxID=92945 RepID=UPI002358A34C|nr:siderophore-interacting protein [Ketogulonicigenium vulgare]